MHTSRLPEIDFIMTLAIEIQERGMEKYSALQSHPVGASALCDPPETIDGRGQVSLVDLSSNVLIHSGMLSSLFR